MKFLGKDRWKFQSKGSLHVLPVQSWEELWEKGKDFWQEEDGVGTVEIILILVVLIGIVIIFQKQITVLVNNIWKSITQQSRSIIG